MNSRKKLWLSGSVVVGALALAAALAIPLVASAGAKAAKCHIKNDAVVDISQFQNDLLNATAQNAKCSGSLVNGSYKPGAIIAPVTAKVVRLKPNSDGTPGYSGQLKTKTFTGTITLNPGPSVCNPCGPSLKVKVRVGVDFKPATVYVEIEKL